MKINLIITLILNLVYVNLSTAQVGNVSDAGEVKSWKSTGSGIEGITENAGFRIIVYNDNTIRVRVSRENKFNDFSYLLDEEAVPLKIDFKVSENGNLISLSTAMIVMEIEKLPMFRVIFKTKDGKVINEDYAGKGFGTGYIGNRSTLYKKLQAGERFVGLGEVLGDLDKRGTGYTLNNTDTYKYGDPRLPMYTNVPFYIGIHHNMVYGLFSHNTFKSFFNFGLSTPEFSSITLEGGNVDYFFMYDTSISGILYNYTYLTGRMPLPPIWSLGYHQSRCSYFPQSNVEIIAETFRRKKLPADCIVLDADYLFEYEPFRINTDRFPDMKALTRKLKELGFEVTASVNPGIKKDSTYFAYTDGLKSDIFIKYADGSYYTADIAPSTNNFPDFTNPKARTWWIEKMKYLPDNGINGYWNDMNEPAVGGSYIPDNLLFDFDGHKANGLEAKNIYGMQMARSSYEAAIKNGGNRRPFILTRSGYAGVQRYAAVWTGDNTAKDEYLLGGILLNTQMGLSGIPFVGDDIGGYIGTTTKELYTRWMQVGMFQPFARNHKEAFANANEPWSYGEEAEAISRSFLEFRYQLLPYLYSKFYEANQTGIPITRSLAIENPFDDKIYQAPYQYQFLCGDAIMVIPVTSHEKAKAVYLPDGEWFDLYSDESIAGNHEYKFDVQYHQIPLFIKASSIIPMQKVIQTTKEIPADTLFVHLYKGTKKNIFTYYEDDGFSNNYKKGNYLKRLIEYDPFNQKLILFEQEGSYTSKFNYIQLILHGFQDEIKAIGNNGQSGKLNVQSKILLNGLNYLEDIYDPTYFKLLESYQKVGVQQTYTFQFSPEKIEISWYN